MSSASMVNITGILIRVNVMAKEARQDIALMPRAVARFFARWIVLSIATIVLATSLCPAILRAPPMRTARTSTMEAVLEFAGVEPARLMLIVSMDGGILMRMSASATLARIALATATIAWGRALSLRNLVSLIVSGFLVALSRLTWNQQIAVDS